MRPEDWHRLSQCVYFDPDKGYRRTRPWAHLAARGSGALSWATPVERPRAGVGGISGFATD